MTSLADLTDQWQERGLLLPIWMDHGKLRLVDQLALPGSFDTVQVDTVDELCEAIKKMVIRGSGALGTCGVYGLVLAAQAAGKDRASIREAAAKLKATRPTAINLHKTLDEMLDAINASDGEDLDEVIEDRGCQILVRQLEFEEQLGEFGADVLTDGDGILTHCHSGALAGSGYGGRALSVIRKAHDQGKDIHVFASETRPYLQGARITVFELEKFGIPHTLITDGMSGYLMRLGRISKVVVGSDRIAANGDLINKIGTYMHALAAKDNKVPFYTATSSHTVDHNLGDGFEHAVEFRDSGEVTQINGRDITVPGTKALYPSFDVTPNHLLSGIITEVGVLTAPFEASLGHLRAPQT